MCEKHQITDGDRDAAAQVCASERDTIEPPRDDRRPSFIERFCVTDAPADLDEVEAAIDAEPRRPWERLAPLAILGFIVGFWGTVIWVFVH